MEEQQRQVREALETVAPASTYDPAIFDAVYDKIKGMIANKEFNLANWVSLVTLSMEVVEVVPNMHGLQKRDLVVDLIAKLVTEIPMSDSDRTLVASLVRTTLPSMIDALVQGSLGQIAINLAAKAEEHVTKCWAKCVKKTE